MWQSFPALRSCTLFRLRRRWRNRGQASASLPPQAASKARECRRSLPIEPYRETLDCAWWYSSLRRRPPVVHRSPAESQKTRWQQRCAAPRWSRLAWRARLLPPPRANALVWFRSNRPQRERHTPRRTACGSAQVPPASTRRLRGRQHSAADRHSATR